ncbi:MAG: hypothetical protein F4Y18_03155 [Cenarchaeum sp. SB0663_bin_5]|nr:hypothetical protein [Cenarchaeum sp. SB0663_bin_5]MYH04505.1 hypothetical protein [Cenarchaeum sp. SB0675_bin_21]MYL11397.1 hypothetical protein [Cenarchaeum sp. SB0669_bin_11]
MSSVDKAAIGWSIGIAAVAVAIAFAGTSNQLPSIDAPIAMPTTSSAPSTSTATNDPFADDAAQVREQSDTMPEEAADAAVPEEAADAAVPEEAADDAMPEEIESEIIEEVPVGPLAWDVITPEGTSVPGCELDDTCFQPSYLTILVGDTVNWVNNDVAAHTVTSGSPQDGPSGVFDSSLVMGGTVFSHTFEEPGTYPYFCLVHPWMIGSVIVE